MSQAEAAKIEQENTNFFNALNAGKITFEQYQQAMAYQKQRMTQLGVTQIPQQQPITENPYAQAQSSQQFTYVRTPKVTEKQEMQRQAEYGKAVIAEDKASFMEPKPTVTGGIIQPTPQPHPAREYNVREGTIIVREGIENIKKAALVTGAAVAAPFIGPSGVIIGAGAGAGLSQGMKAIEGQGLLTPSEALESALTGVVFGGVGKAVNVGLKFVGASRLVEGFGSGVTKAVTGGFGRAGVNAVMGGGAGYIFSGGSLEDARDSALLGAGLSVAGDVTGGLISKFRGPSYKGTELKGLKEIELQKNTGYETSGKRLTEPVLKEVKLSKSEALYYSKTSQGKIRMDLAGTEKTMLRGGGEAVTYQKPYESTRSFDPVKAAINKEPYTLRKIQTGEINRFVETPSRLNAVRELKVTVGSKRGAPAIYSEQKIVTGEKAILPELKMTSRDITGIQLRSKIESPILLDTKTSKPVKLPTEIGKNIAGQIASKQGTSPVKMAPTIKGRMKPFTDYSQPTETVRTKAITETVTRTKTSEVTLPRNIIKVESILPKQTLKLSGVPRVITYKQAANNEEDVAEEFFSYPQSGLKIPQGIKPISTDIFQPLKHTTTQNLDTPISTPVKIGTDLNKFKLPPRETILTDDTSKDTYIKPKLIPSQMNKFDYLPVNILSPNTSQRTKTDLKTGLKTSTLNFNKLSAPAPLKAVKTSYPVFRLGGGSGSKSGSNLFGKWSEKKNPIKDYKSMMRTFGIGGKEKRRRKR